MKSILYAVLTTVMLFSSCAEETEKNAVGSIYGIITDKSTGEPMRAAGIELHIQDINRNYSLLTRTVAYDDGHFEFNELKVGGYKLKVTAKSYNEIEYSLVVESNRTVKGDMQLEKQKTYMTVRTLEIADIGGNYATFKGDYDYANYNYRPNEYGFAYATIPNPINGGTRITTSSGFTTIVTNLPKATYYVQAYAKNSVGTEYGEGRSFQIKGTPSAVTFPATNITASAATLNASVKYHGDPHYTERGFVYSNTFKNPTIEDNGNDTKKKIVPGTSIEFSANISELTAETTYYTRTYITNEDGTEYGESISFKPTAIVDYIILELDGMMVQKKDISSGADWTTANDLCKSSKVGGYSDWRLPTIGELQVLYSKKTTIGGFSNSVYWSGTALSFNAVSGYWELDLTDGGDGGYNGHMKTRSYRARAVRALP